MKKVLLEMDILFLGGSEKQFRNIISALNNCSGCELHVLIENQSLVDDVDLTDEFVKKNNNVEFHFLNSRAMRYNHSKKIVRYVTKWISLIYLYLWHMINLQGMKIDTVMVNNMTGLMMVPILKRSGCRVIYNERNTGRQVTDKNFKIKLLKKCDTVIANSKAAAEYLEGVICKKVEVCNNGLIIEKPLKKKNKSKTFQILLPGRINPIKNQLYVIEALSKLPEADYKLILAGGVEDSVYKNKIDQFIINNHLEDKVIQKGFVSDMKHEYEEADLVILPSIEEGTPNVLLEAYMYGRATLCSDIRQNIDCTVEPKSIFPLNNTEKLSQILADIFSGTYFDDFEEMIKKNIRFVSDNYNIKKMDDCYRALLLDGEENE